MAKWPNTPFMLKFFFLFAVCDLFFLTLLPVDDAGKIEAEINCTNPGQSRKEASERLSSVSPFPSR